MASTRTVQDTINWAATILKQNPLQVANMEPGLTSAQIVLQRMLGPPMRWRFNRGNFSFAISPAGGTDYIVVVNDLGWIETQWLVDAAGIIHQLEGAVELAMTTTPMRPKVMAPVYDDNAGNITFRLNAVPTAADTIAVDYQRKAPPITSYGCSWTPFPDEYGYIYTKLFLAAAAWLTGDLRAQMWGQEGAAALFGAQTGLTAQDRAIFLGEWERSMRSLASAQDFSKAGNAGLTR
jgi:hypothetical protein